MTTNSTTIPFQVPFLRLQRLFPQDAQPLSVEMDRSYTDIANAVNARVLGFFPTSRSVQTGEGWYFTSSRRSSFRQVFSFTATGNIAHGISWSGVYSISPHSYGVFTDGTSQYGVIFSSSTAIAGQISFYVTSTNIVIVAGAGAPTITSGFVVIEWIVQA